MDEPHLLFLTTHYYKLQTLRLAPPFIMFSAAPWIDLRQVGIGMGLVALAVCIFWHWLLGAYYKRRLGRIETRTTHDQRYWTVLAVSFWPFVLYYVIRGQHFPPELFCVLAASTVLAEAFSSSNIPLRRNYYIAASAFLFLVFVSAQFPRIFGHRSLFQKTDSVFLSFGVVMLALGVLDHFLLLSFFRRSSEEIHA